jgi:hypothetical protein
MIGRSFSEYHVITLLIMFLGFTTAVQALPLAVAAMEVEAVASLSHLQLAVEAGAGAEVQAAEALAVEAPVVEALAVEVLAAATVMEGTTTHHVPTNLTMRMIRTSFPSAMAQICCMLP